jgi:dTDP-4-dehydrorhamnose 3,5-epimerase
VEPEERADERGTFARVFCAREFAQAGAPSTFVQANHSVSARRGTLRGLHAQRAPHAEAKLVRCTRGALYDVVLDLRPRSPTFGLWNGVELRASSSTMVLVPEGCAHGFLTLADATEALYLVSEFYSPAAEYGIRWNDPRFDIRWPFDPIVISEKDGTHPLWQP